MLCLLIVLDCAAGDLGLESGRSRVAWVAARRAPLSVRAVVDVVCAETDLSVDVTVDDGALLTWPWKARLAPFKATARAAFRGCVFGVTFEIEVPRLAGVACACMSSFEAQADASIASLRRCGALTSTPK